jgi:hypothetical protein
VQVQQLGGRRAELSNRGRRTSAIVQRMTPEEIAAKSADPNRPKNWDDRLKRHEKAMKERHSPQSKDTAKRAGGKAGGSGRSGGKGGGGKGGGPATRNRRQ